jgi:hypothetical protein
VLLIFFMCFNIKKKRPQFTKPYYKLLKVLNQALWNGQALQRVRIIRKLNLQFLQNK